MKLEKTKSENGATLTVAIEGSVDTVTAPELEKALSEEYAGLKELILDFSKVDYISSAGLRVVMGADQQMEGAGKMVLRNVNDDVREVFEMTGFDELLTIE